MDCFKTSMSEPEPILYPNLNDVLSGRGNAANNHPGNVFFREQVKNYKTQYVVSSPASWMKLKIAETIVNIVASQDPPGRFLKQDSDNGKWYPLHEKDVIKKVRQALAEGASEILKKHGKTGKTGYIDDCDPQPSTELAYTHLPTEKLSRQALAEGASEIVKKLGNAVKSGGDYNPFSPMNVPCTPLPIGTVAATISSSELASESREALLQKRENAKKRILSLLGMDADCDTGPDGTILIPHDNDVLSGRGNAVNNHPGNVFFRDQVKYYKSEYILFTPASWMKCKIAETVVEIIRNQNPPGRFLKQADTGGVWYPLDEKDIIKKVRQALREGTSDILKPEKNELSNGNANKDTTSQTKNQAKATISNYDMEVRRVVKNCPSYPPNHSNMTAPTSTSTNLISDCKPSIHQAAESRGGGNPTEPGELESTRDCILSLLSLSQGYESTTKSNNKNNEVPETVVSTQPSSFASFPSSSNQEGRNISMSRSRETFDSKIVYKKAKLHS